MAQSREHYECDICQRTFTRKYNLRTHITNCHMNPNCYCDICDSHFGSVKGLQKHLARGHNRYQQGYPECDICGRIFTRKQNITSHMVTVHLQGSGDQICCSICQKTFTTERNLKRHTNQLHNPNIEYPTCDECNRVFKGKHSLLAHIQSNHGYSDRVIAKCDLCDKVYTNNRSLKRHTEMYHGQKAEHRCGLCPKVYTSNQSLRRHTRSVHNLETAEWLQPLPLKELKLLKCHTCLDVYYDQDTFLNHTSNCKLELCCQTCGLRFSEEPILRQHVKNQHTFDVFYEYCKEFLMKKEETKTPKIPYNCEYCDKAFSNVYDLKEHMRSKHYKLYSLCSCNVCFSKFYTKESLDEHKKSCTIPPGAHSCRNCDKLFTDISSLIFHTRIFHPQTEKHQITSENTYKCMHCKRVYYSDRSLKHHVKLKHTTEEMVECELCGKICNNKYYLASHIKIVHTEQALSKCDYCDKEFKSKRNIRRHIEYTHMGMQRYKCIECETLFKEKRSLRKHVRVKHPNSTTFPQCHICQKRFESAKSCKIHLKLVHSYNMNTHPCDLCSVSFKSLELLKIHLQTNHLAEDEIYKCEDCNIVLKGQDNFDQHNDTYHSSYMLNQKVLPKCYICMKDFSTRKTLKRHIRRFHSQFDVEQLANFGVTYKHIGVDCGECLKKFQDDNIFERITDNDSIVFRCDHCGGEYDVFEYTVHRHRVLNNDSSKDKMILSELCTAEISGDDMGEDFDLFSELAVARIKEEIQDVKMEPVSP